jgi:hypothetical protein
MMVLPGVCLRSVLIRDAARTRVLCECVSSRAAPASPLAHDCELHLLYRGAGLLHNTKSSADQLIAAACIVLAAMFCPTLL